MYDYDLETEVVEDEETESSEKEMPSFNHSYICTEILDQLLQNRSIMPLTELTLDIGKGIIPDISVYQRGKFQPNFRRDIRKFPEAPTIAIEVISPSQDTQELLEKAVMLVENGVKAVWTVEPFTDSVFVTTKDGEQLFHNQAIESEGIRVDFKRIFGG